MNTDAMTEKIRDEARGEAQATLAQARERAAQISAQSHEKCERLLADALQKANAEAEEMRGRMQRMAQLDTRKAVLQVKRDMMNEAFALALDKMNAMPPKKARAMYRLLLLESAEGGEMLYIGADNRAWFDDAFLREVNQALKAPLKLSGASCAGMGFVLERDDMRIDGTNAAILEAQRLGMEADVARTLFD